MSRGKIIQYFARKVCQTVLYAGKFRSKIPALYRIANIHNAENSIFAFRDLCETVCEQNVRSLWEANFHD